LDEVNATLSGACPQEFNKVFDFFKLMAICHTVVIDVDQQTGERKL
jgi:hypothetical protein